MKNARQFDAELFGRMGVFTAKLYADVSRDFIGKQYEFMGTSKYEGIKNLSEKMNQVYWRETLLRVYWAAALNLMRHQRWQAGCASAFNAPANLLSFAANLRGLVEGALDANYSLAPVPFTLAGNRMMIESALEGRLEELFIAKELEERLIHFVYARKTGKGDGATNPASHTALKPKDYRNAIGLPAEDRVSFSSLYDELCGLCHPTAYSLAFLWDQTTRGDAYTIHITGGEDDARIRALCQKFEKTIELAMSLSVTVSALCLKTLNWFSLPEVRCTSIERWNFDDVPAWKKVRAMLSEGVAQ